ncbi:MAG: FtsX-like permease family protein [Balneolaceae bacterium]|nr:MAG: FtsX-like permease family protein [Balneolaceae bacterium]
MLNNYLKIAFRNLLRNAGYSVINILGLAIGVVCTLLILLYVFDELSYDRYHPESELIYRVVQKSVVDGVGEPSAANPFPLRDALLNDYPDLVELAVRFFNLRAYKLTLSYNNEYHFNERRFFFTDPEVFNVFGFRLEEGDERTALVNPNTLVMTRETARKYFGDAEPVGKTLRFEGRLEMEVTGILEAIPENTHFQADILASMGTVNNLYSNGIPTDWFFNPCWTYIKVRSDDAAANLKTQMDVMVGKYYPESFKTDMTLALQPLHDIRLHSRFNNEIAPTSNILYIYIFSIIAIFVLLIACINFMNLATARASRRALEVGMRKVLGAEKKQLVGQFLGESFLVSLIAVLLSVLLMQLVLPSFNSFTGKELSFNPFHEPMLAAALAGIVILVGFISGIYPAIFLSSFNPVTTLKGGFRSGRGNSMLRQGLVVVQFSISIIMLTGTVVVWNQLNYMRNAELGFEKDHVVVIQSHLTAAIWNYDNLKQALLDHSSVLSVTGSETVIGSKYQVDEYIPVGTENADEQLFHTIMVHHDFAETFGLEIIAGRGFSDRFATDKTEAVMVNRTLVGQLGWTPENAIGRPFRKYDNEQLVIGVFEDFNYTGLHEPISPMILDMPDQDIQVAQYIRYISVRVAPGNPRTALDHIEQVWARFDPTRPVEYFMLDEELAALYAAEEMMGRIAGLFALFCVFVACLGLLGLASYTTQMRKKDIGIRKVMGASVINIVNVLSFEYLKLVLFSVLIAWPVSWFALNWWLENFAYRTSVTVWILLAATVITILVAFITVSYQTVKAAYTNPVDALKTE